MSLLHKLLGRKISEVECLIELERLIQDGNDINSKDHNHITPIMLACKYGMLSVVKWLLDKEVNAALVDKRNQSALHYILKIKRTDIIPCVERIINTGCVINMPDDNGRTPLLIACEGGVTQIVLWLLNHGAGSSSVNVRNKQSALHCIVQHDTEDIVQCVAKILDTDCNVNALDIFGRTPLCIAVERDNIGIVRLLIDTASDVNIPTKDGKTPIYISVCNNNIGISRLLINAGSMANIANRHGVTPLFKAICNNSIDIVGMLIDADCYINMKGLPNGKDINNINIVSMLIGAGCEVNIFNEHCINTLQNVTIRQKQEFTNLLTDYGTGRSTKHPDSTLQVDDIITILNYLHLLASAIDSGVAIETLKNTGENILHLIAKVYFDYPYFNYDMLRYKLNLYCEDENGNSPVMVAALLNNQPYLTYLTQLNLDINDKNHKGHTALHMCIIGFTFIKENLNKVKVSDIVEELCAFNYYPTYSKCINVLLSARADVNIQDDDGITALMLAVKKNDIQLVLKLIEYKADISIQNNCGMSALRYIDLKNTYNPIYFKLLLTNEQLHLLDIPWINGNTLIQNVMFPCFWSVEETCSFIKFLVAHNVCLQKLTSVDYHNNSYNQISLNEFSSADRNKLRFLLYVSGAPITEIINILNFNREDYMTQGSRSAFSLLCNGHVSLQDHCRRVIRQRVGLRLRESISELHCPMLMYDYLLLRDFLSFKYSTLAFFNADDYGSTGGTDSYDLDATDDYQDYNISHYNLLSSYHVEDDKGVYEFDDANDHEYDIKHYNLMSCYSEDVVINVQDANGKTALYRAVERDNIEEVTACIRDGFDVNTQTVEGIAPIYTAVCNDNTDIVKVLTDADCCVDIQTTVDCETPLYRAVCNNNIGIVTILIHAHSNVNIQTRTGETPLYRAVSDNRIDIVKKLIQVGGDVNIQTMKGRTPLFEAVKENSIDIVILLICAGSHLETTDGMTPLYEAVANNNNCMARVLIKAGCDVNTHNRNCVTPLYEAVDNNNVEIVRMLIDANSKVNIQDKYGITPLDKAIQNDNNAIVKMLIKAGGDINMQTNEEKSPLYRAVYTGNVPVLRMMTHANCEFKFSNQAGLQVLHTAARRKYKDVINLLIDHELSILTRHSDNKLQLVDYVLSRNDMDSLEFLLTSGLYVDTVTNDGESLLHLFAKVYFDYSYFKFEELLYYEQKINCQNNCGDSPLMIAAFLNNQPFLVFLTEVGCNIDDQNGKGRTALHMCIIGFSFIKEILNEKMLNCRVHELCAYNYYPVYIQCFDVLLAEVSDVNIPDNEGIIALMLAIKKNDPDIVHKLLNCNADVNIKDNFGRTALQYLDLSYNVYDPTCLKLLLSNGANHQLNLPVRDGNTIIQKAMLFPGAWEVQETCSFITFLVAHNVSLHKLETDCGINCYKDLTLTEFDSKQRTELRKLLYLSGAPYSEIIKSLDFDMEDENSLSGEKEKFRLFCARISLKDHCIRVIRQVKGLRLKEDVSELDTQIVPRVFDIRYDQESYDVEKTRSVRDFLLLKHVVPPEYFTVDFLDVVKDEADYDDYDSYDLDEDDEGYQNIDIKYYNLMSCYVPESVNETSRRNIDDF